MLSVIANSLAESFRLNFQFTQSSDLITFVDNGIDTDPSSECRPKTDMFH